MRWRQRALESALAALLASMAPVSAAFHEGGVGFCDGCHVLHGEEETQGLLRGSDVSSTCLRCHAEAGPENVLSEDGSSFTPGGDFYWLDRTYSWSDEMGGETHFSPGERHGHNVVARDYMMRADTSLTTAPGGSYPAADLSCVSCHDPHGHRNGDEDGGLPIWGSGSYPGGWSEGAEGGNYRLLGGIGHEASGASFSHAAPVALAPLSWEETDQNHVDYGSGMSEWCANCHASIHGPLEGQHPVGEDGRFSAEAAETYGAYLRTGDFSGSPSLSYMALVPFERGVSDPALLDPASRSGPDAGVSNVMCLSCHRAHASAFRSIGRWDFSTTFLAESHLQSSDAGAGATDALNAYYGRTITAEFGRYQRSLCNKCHALD